MAQQKATVTWHGDAITAAVHEAAAKGLLQGAEYVLGEAVEIVPLDEATLARSGVASVDEEQLVAAVSFDTPYAVDQHEDLTKRHAPGRQAKYLETPLNASGDVVMGLVAKQIRGVTKT